MNTKFSKMALYSFLVILFFSLQQLSGWLLITFSGIRGLPYFIDLGSVLKSSDCANQFGWGIYDPEIAQGCSYIYGSSLIRIFHIFQISQSATYIAGWALLVAFSIFIGTTFYSFELKKTRHWILGVVVIFSPPTMLLVERANIDILIVLLLAFCALALAKNQTFLSYVVLFISSIIKFYTAPVFLWLALVGKTLQKRIVAILFLLFSLIVILQDLSKINGGFPRESWASFGNPIFGMYGNQIGYNFSFRIQAAIGLLVLVIITLIIYFVSKRFSMDWPEVDLEVEGSYIKSLAKIFALVFLFCYFASSNYDYRLVFLFIPALFFISSSHLDFKLEMLLSICLVATAWFSFNSSYLQIVGDLAILPWIAVFLRSTLYDFGFHIKVIRNRYFA